MSDKPLIELDTDLAMRIIADRVWDVCQSDEYCFIVTVTKFRDIGATANYISNGKRADVVKALRAQADILEQKLDIVTDESGEDPN